MRMASGLEHARRVSHGAAYINVKKCGRLFPTALRVTEGHLSCLGMRPAALRPGDYAGWGAVLPGVSIMLALGGTEERSPCSGWAPALSSAVVPTQAVFLARQLGLLSLS